MRKVTRRILSMVLAVMMVVSVLVITPKTDAEASMTIPSKVRCGVGFQNYNTHSLYFQGSGYKIYKLKVNNKKLHVKASYKSTSDGRADLAMYADTNGVYKVSFYIMSAAGRVVGSRKTITVYAAGTGSILRQVTVGNITTRDTNVDTILYTNQKKAKIYVKALPGIQLKKIEVGKYTSTGEDMKYVKIKNGRTITLSNCGYSYFHEYSDKTFYQYQGFMAETKIKITYVDKFSSSNSESSTYVYIYKRASEWAY